MSLLAIAYPNISGESLSWIQNYRMVNDHLYSAVDPHFTLIFPVVGISESEFIAEIVLRAKHTRKIEFLIQKVLLHKDPLSDRYHEFLVPDKGYQEVTALHDLLYSGKLLPHLKREIEYIPHIGIGSSKDRGESMNRVNKLDPLNLNIYGTIEYLTITKYENHKVEDLTRIELN